MQSGITAFMLRNSTMPMESWPADGLGSGEESKANASAVV